MSGANFPAVIRRTADDLAEMRATMPEAARHRPAQLTATAPAAHTREAATCSPRGR